MGSGFLRDESVEVQPQSYKNEKSERSQAKKGILGDRRIAQGAGRERVRARRLKNTGKFSEKTKPVGVQTV